MCGIILISQILVKTNNLINTKSIEIITLGEHDFARED